MQYVVRPNHFLPQSVARFHFLAIDRNHRDAEYDTDYVLSSRCAVSRCYIHCIRLSMWRRRRSSWERGRGHASRFAILRLETALSRIRLTSNVQDSTKLNKKLMEWSSLEWIICYPESSIYPEVCSMTLDRQASDSWSKHQINRH